MGLPISDEHPIMSHIHTVGTVKGHTLAGGFTKSLKELVHRLEETAPHFIRCIKPNEDQRARSWDQVLVRRQLKYSGVMETTTIRKVCFPFPLPLPRTCPRVFLRVRTRRCKDLPNCCGRVRKAHGPETAEYAPHVLPNSSPSLTQINIHPRLV
jgi:hypothetical protein